MKAMFVSARPRYGTVWTAAALVLGLLAALWTSGAAAQQWGTQIPAERLEAVWSLQAKCVADALELDEETAGKLAAAYKESRKSLQEALANTSGSGQERFQAMQRVTTAEREKLEQAIAGILTEEQAGKTAALTSFSRQWDSFVSAIVDLDLDAERQAKAMALTADYAASTGGALAGMRGGGGTQDIQELRRVAQERREQLDAAMAEVLDEAETTKWRESTAVRTRGGAPAARPGGGN